LQISSEEDAWALAEAIVADRKKIDLKDVQLKFLGWPKLTVYIEKPPLAASISPPMMEALLEFQSELYRAIAELKYSHRDARRLSDDDREAYEILVQVKDGSSDIQAALESALNKFVEGAIGKMEPEHIVVTAIGLALATSATIIFKKYLNDRKEVRLAEIDKEKQSQVLAGITALSEQESKRLELLNPLFQKSVSPELLETGFEGSRDALLRAVSRGPSAKVQGVTVYSEDAHELRRSARRTPTLSLVSKEVRVIDMDTSNVTRRIVNFRDIATGQDFGATIEDAVFEEAARKTLVNALDTRTTVWVEMKVKEFEGEYRDIRVLTVSVEPPAKLKQ
jgi:hypothetical protein